MDNLNRYREWYLPLSNGQTVVVSLNQWWFLGIERFRETVAMHVYFPRIECALS